MVRPRKDRIVTFNPEVCYFKPRGIPLVELEEVRLTVDECEALRIADLLGTAQEDGGRLMGVSRATFGRIVQRARRIVADALINGKAISIEGGNYRMVSEVRRFCCELCQHEWEEPKGTGRPRMCPACKQPGVRRVRGCQICSR
jgi:predicted DNA-binding protein (UPF0251 family)